MPGEFYQRVVAATFGTTTYAIFPAPKRDASADLLAASGIDTLELVSRLQHSDMDQATLDGLRITAERLCSGQCHTPRHKSGISCFSRAFHWCWCGICLEG